MIKLTKVRLKNFLSYGNAFTDYNFQSGITRISGSNYSGKSSVVDAIYYGLFGKPYRKVNLPSLVNSINKRGLCVELYFETNNSQFKIIRGLKPNLFEIYQDDVLVDVTSHKKDYQKWLEDEVLDFNSDIFDQIGIKSLTRYESFLTIPKGKKRSIVEKLFGIEVLSDMKELNKLIIDNIEDDIKELEKTCEHLEDLIRQEAGNIDYLKELQSQIQHDTEEKNQVKLAEIDSIKSDIESLSESLTQFEQSEWALTEMNKEINNLHNEGVKIRKIIEDARTEQYVIKGNIDFMRSKCPDCPKLKTIDFHSDTREQETIVEIQNKNLVEQESRRDEFRKLMQHEKDILEKRPIVLAAIKSKKQEIKKINKSIEDIIDVVKIDESKYKKLQSKLKRHHKKITNLNELLKYRAVGHGLLMDEAIRSHIIKKFIPLLNKLMNTYLQKFGIDLDMIFNTNLDIIIKTKFKEGYSYDNFSEGEKKRINLAVTFTFLEFCKLKHHNANVNVLVLDEFASGLDPEGEAIMYGILKDIAEREGKEVITITHNPSIDPDNIQRHFHASLSRGFSQLEEINDVL